MEEILYKNRGNKPTKSGFGEGLLEAGLSNGNIFVLGADITASVGANLFAERFPERFYSLGIAEQNCVGVAVGMALSGKIPVFSTYAAFLAHRASDQIRISVCYNNVHVVLGGAHAGISVGPDGATHQALEDIAVMRSLPNMTVISPCDATQTKIAVLNAINNMNSPVYIRFGREGVPDFTLESQDFKIGKGQSLKKGKDLTIIATGHMVWYAIQAADELIKYNIDAGVINIHTIKPIDEEIIVNAAKDTKRIITVEEHQINGGLGSAVAEVVVKYYPVPVKIIGINDTFGESGKPEELMLKYGLSTENIVKNALELMNY
jgi:transketolase